MQMKTLLSEDEKSLAKVVSKLTGTFVLTNKRIVNIRPAAKGHRVTSIPLSEISSVNTYESQQAWWIQIIRDGLKIIIHAPSETACKTFEKQISKQRFKAESA